MHGAEKASHVQRRKHSNNLLGFLVISVGGLDACISEKRMVIVGVFQHVGYQPLAQQV